MSHLRNLQTKSRHHFPAALMERFEDEVNIEEVPDLQKIRVAFIVWDKNSPHSYAVVFYKEGHQCFIYEYNTDDHPLDWIPVDDEPMAA